MSGDALDRKRYERMKAEWRRLDFLTAAARICENLDRAAAYSSPTTKQAAADIAAAWIEMARR